MLLQLQLCVNPLSRLAVGLHRCSSGHISACIRVYVCTATVYVEGFAIVDEPQIVFRDLWLQGEHPNVSYMSSLTWLSLPPPPT